MKYKSKLEEILTTEGWTKTMLDKACIASLATIRRAARNEKISDTKRYDIVKGLNILAGEQKYTYEQLFG